MAALNPLYFQDTLPTTSAAAIREFNERYLAAIGASQPTGWADSLGELLPSSSPMVSFPVSQLRTLYTRTEGEQKFKTLREKSFDIKSEEFDDGYEAKLMDLFLQVFAYRNWQQAPSRLVLAEEQHRHNQIAALLTAGTGLTCVDGKNFFATDHPVNMTTTGVKTQSNATTWSNYDSTGLDILGAGISNPDISNIQAQVIDMQTGVPDENGQLLGVDPDTLLVPADKKEAVTNMLAKDRLVSVFGSNTAAAPSENPYKNRFNIVGVKEFGFASGSTADWYLVDSKLVKAGVAPWISMRQTVPASLALRNFDESSDFFKNTGRIKMSSHIWYGFALALPHAIRRVKGETR